MLILTNNYYSEI